MIFMEPYIRAGLMGAPRVQRMILMDYARFMGAVLAVGAGGAAAADAAYGRLPHNESRFELNPLSSNFLKPRLGKDGQTRLDITGAGHLCNLCRPDFYNQALIGFLESALTPA